MVQCVFMILMATVQVCRECLYNKLIGILLILLNVGIFTAKFAFSCVRLKHSSYYIRYMLMLNKTSIFEEI